MSIREGYKANLEIIKLAVRNDDIALVECTDKVTGAVVIVLCAIGSDGDEYVISPLAKMFDGNPYDELEPPT